MQIERYELNRPWDHPGFHSSLEFPDEPQIAFGKGYHQTGVYDAGRFKFDDRNLDEVMAAAQAERSRHLYTCVVLQTLLDLCNPRYIGTGECHPVRYEAIRWIEGRTEDDRNDRDEVLDLAGIEDGDLMEGYSRIKEAGFDLLKLLDSRTLLEHRDIIVALSNDYSEILPDGKLH